MKRYITRQTSGHCLPIFGLYLKLLLRRIKRFLICILIGTASLFALLLITSRSNGLNSASCDSDCIKFRLLLSNWPVDRPKSIIYFLTHLERLDKLQASLLSVDKYFNERYQYPIVIFHELDLSSESFRRQVRSWVFGPVFFQLVSFSVPSFVNVTLARYDKPCIHSIGYRHMCRFHAKEIYKQPILTGVEYAWRLDDDSVLLGNVPYDLFTFMKENDFIYGFRALSNDSLVCIRGLWPATEHYIKARTLCLSHKLVASLLYVYTTKRSQTKRSLG